MRQNPNSEAKLVWDCFVCHWQMERSHARAEAKVGAQNMACYLQEKVINTSKVRQGTEEKGVVVTMGEAENITVPKHKAV